MWITFQFMYYKKIYSRNHLVKKVYQTWGNIKKGYEVMLFGAENKSAKVQVYLIDFCKIYKKSRYMNR